MCGGRDYDDAKRISEILVPLPKDDTLIHGAARGADRLAGRIWKALGRTLPEEYPADWKRHGKAAGPIRNQQMLDTGIDLVVAFPGGAGTADMVGRAKKAGVKVVEVTDIAEIQT